MLTSILMDWSVFTVDILCMIKKWTWRVLSVIVCLLWSWKQFQQPIIETSWITENKIRCNEQTTYYPLGKLNCVFLFLVSFWIFWKVLRFIWLQWLYKVSLCTFWAWLLFQHYISITNCCTKLKGDYFLSKECNLP